MCGDPETKQLKQIKKGQVKDEPLEEESRMMSIKNGGMWEVGKCWLKCYAG